MAIDFGKIHKNFNGKMFDLCMECGGQCEKNEIAVFLPNEVEFVAKKLNIGPQKFIGKFCNTIYFKKNKIYIAKAGVCPFLNKRNKCELEKLCCKIVRCLVYPAVINLSKNKVKIGMDYNSCPMAYRVSDSFRNKAYKVYRSIKKEIPKWWLEFVSRYSERTYDYSKLEKLRNKKIISIAELENCILNYTETRKFSGFNYPEPTR